MRWSFPSRALFSSFMINRKSPATIGAPPGRENHEMEGSGGRTRCRVSALSSSSRRSGCQLRQMFRSARPAPTTVEGASICKQATLTLHGSGMWHTTRPNHHHIKSYTRHNECELGSDHSIGSPDATTITARGLPWASVPVVRSVTHTLRSGTTQPPATDHRRSRRREPFPHVPSRSNAARILPLRAASHSTPRQPGRRQG
ncbi:hypothetical protein VUR80DRAFT_4269 [Thermomyces stellatus]